MRAGRITIQEIAIRYHRRESTIRSWISKARSEKISGFSEPRDWNYWQDGRAQIRLEMSEEAAILLHRLYGTIQVIHGRKVKRASPA